MKGLTQEAAELHALLTEDGRELLNFKPIPGSNPTPEGLCAEAKRVLKSVTERNLPHTPPVSGVPKTEL